MSSLTSISGGASSESCAASLSDVWISRIFGFLSPEELTYASCVSKQWREFVDSPVLWDLQTIFRQRGHTLNVIDKKVWAACTGLEVDESLFPSKRTIFLVVKQMFASLEIEGDAGLTLLTLPPVTLRELQTRLSDRIRYMYTPVLAQHGDVPMTKTRLVAITNNILKRSWGLSASVQEALVLGKGYEMIGVTAVVALAILTEKSSSEVAPTRLFGIGPWTYTRCAELVDDYRVVVGGFIPSGLHIPIPGLVNDANLGVGCLREFV